MDRQVFERVLTETVAGLPERFRVLLEDVVIIVEDVPKRGPRRNAHTRLLGLYEGIPVTEWGRDFSGKLPDTITLYRENIEAAAETDAEIPHVIRETLLHEIAHHFGLDHDRIGPMERRWKKGRRDR